jgi:cobalt-zinc-cadmium efflux system outer membrane protein
LPAGSDAQPAEESEALAEAPAIALDELVELAWQHNPTMAMARTRVQAARGRLVQAGLYLNPMLLSAAENMPVASAGAAGGQGLIFWQDIITHGKRRRAMAAAAHGVTVADWQALARWYDVLTRTRLAYFDLLTARLEVTTTQEIVALARLDLEAARKLLKAGAGVKPDELRALVQLDQSLVQEYIARQRLTAAGQMLIAAVGVPDLRVASVAGPFPPVPEYDWQRVLEIVLTSSAPVQEAQAAVLQAEELHRLAVAERCPNMRVQVRPLYNFPHQHPDLSVWIGAPIPIFNRNQGNILAAEADLAQAREQVRAVELRLREQLAAAFQRYEAARRQVETYQHQLLPNARESLRLIRLGYEKGDPKYDFTAVNQAQQILAQAQLVYVRSLGELWRAVSEIAGLLQQDALVGMNGAK